MKAVWIALIATLGSLPALATTAGYRSPVRSGDLLDRIDQATSADDRLRQAIHDSQHLQVPGDDPAYREVFLELFRLQQLPGGNPTIFGLEDMGINPTQVDKLKKSLLDPAHPLSRDQLSRLGVLLRVENQLHREPTGIELYRKIDSLNKQMLDSLVGLSFAKLTQLGGQLQTAQDALRLQRRKLLLDMARHDLKGITEYRAEYAKYRIHFPIGLRTALEAAAKQSGLKKYNLKIAPDNQSFSLPLNEVLSLLAGKGGDGLPIGTLLPLAARVHALNRALRGDLASRDDASDLLGDALQRLREQGVPVPPGNPLRGSGPIAGSHGAGTSPPPEYYFERANPDQEHAPGNDGSPNACFDDPLNTVNKDQARLSNHDITHFNQVQGAPETSFRIVINSKSLDAKGKEGNCLASIAQIGDGNELPAAPGRPPGWKRAVLLGVTHCFPDDVTQIRIAGIGTIPRNQMVVHKMPGAADTTAIAFDLPPELSGQLEAQSHRFVKVPAPDSAIANSVANQTTVKTDINFSRYGGNNMIGKTFPIEGAEQGNFIGLNFLHWVNQGEGIDPGTSGAAVVGPGNIYYGSVSYKCLDGDFGGGVGGMAGGKKTYAYLNNLIKPGGTALTEFTPRDPVLIAHAQRYKAPDQLGDHTRKDVSGDSTL